MNNSRGESQQSSVFNKNPAECLNEKKNFKRNVWAKPYPEHVEGMKYNKSPIAKFLF